MRVLWLTGTVVLLFAFCAVEFYRVRKAQDVAATQRTELVRALESYAGTGSAARREAPVADASLQNLGLELQNFMREQRSSGKGVQRRLSDMEERISRVRETMLQDLDTFLRRLEEERQRFGTEIDRLRAEYREQGLPEAVRMERLLSEMEDRMAGLGRMLQEDRERREEMYSEETEGMQIQGTVQGPGAETRSRY